MSNPRVVEQQNIAQPQAAGRQRPDPDLDSIQLQWALLAGPAWTTSHPDGVLEFQAPGAKPRRTKR